MNRRIFLSAICATHLATAAPATIADKAFARLYEFDFPAVHQIASSRATDPLAHGARAAAILFSEFSRLNIWEGEDFFESGKRSKAKPDPAVRASFYQALGQARGLADAALQSNPKDVNALFTQTMSHGLETDYIAFVERRSLASFEPCKISQRWADRLLAVDPSFHDAYLTTGVNEYMMGALPGVLRWAVRVETTKGDKKKGLEHLEMVAKSGRYFPGFAKILLAVFYEREKQPTRAEAVLLDLSRSYPGNPLFAKQYERLRLKTERTISK